MKKPLIVLIIFLVLGLGGYLFFKEGTLAVDKTDTTPQPFVIEQGENLDTIINNLSKQELIRNRMVFRLVVEQKGLGKKIQAGDFLLSPSMNAYEIADQLQYGTSDVIVTVPEGLRKEEIAEIISQKFDIPETEFKELATEGYLFPETYRVTKNPTAEEIITLMKNTFESRYTADMREKARKLELTDDEVVILASLVEREAKYDEDRQEIASIILRRYQENYPLQIDATVQYVLGYQANEKRWWKSALTFDDLEIDSAYNTYKYPGIPPAPISNPGIASIQAVVNANPNTPYFYYLHDPSGHAHYGKTLGEHELNIERYLR